jgi:hypothetical protein
MATRFVCARGMLSPGDRSSRATLIVVSSEDERHLHGGVLVSADGTFEILFDEDPRASWERQGVHAIAIVAEVGGQRRATRGIDRRDNWRLHELPIVDVELCIDDEDSNRAHRKPNGANGSALAASGLIGLNATGAAVAAVQSQLIKLGYTIPPNEVEAKVFGTGTHDKVRTFQSASGLTPSGVVDGATLVALADAVAAQSGGPQVDGRVLLDSGLPAPGLMVRLYDRRFGGRATKLAEVNTDAHGYFVLRYASGKQPRNLDVRSVDADGKEWPLSTTRFKARTRETLNLIAPSELKPAASEFQRLHAALTPHIGDGDLQHAREDSDQQDLSLLHNATGWDARLLALAATAARQEAQTGVPAEALYALYRSGLPANGDQLARSSVGDVEALLRSARSAGIIGLSDVQISAAKTALEKAAPKLLLTSKSPGALSTFGELIDQTSLAADEKTKFASLFLAHRDGGTTLWDQAVAAGISQVRVDALRVQGKLAFLTVNNAALAGSLLSELRSPTELSKLVDSEFYDDQAWRTRISQLSGGDPAKLAALIPPLYQAASVDDRLNLYAADLARRVRISFPTQVVARMIQTDRLQLGSESEHAATKKPVSAFLQRATGLGFRLGQVPIDRFVQKNRQALFDPGTTDEQIAQTLRAVKRLQRLYQMTPSNRALQTMYRLGFNSAQEVSQYSEQTFVDKFGSEFDDPSEPNLILRKAQQIGSATFGFFSVAKQLDDTTTVYGMSSTNEEKQKTKQGLIERFPTIAQLFGPLDFCACEDCRSVLSPAAYFVDLLHFLDPKDPPQPYSVLTDPKRRPDLANLRLTCENTNTAMPYIDIVNEILEYFVVNGQLGPDAARDTGTAKSEDLISEPQNILTAAYDNELSKARYPIGLPFQLWLETVRRFLGHFDTPFWQLLELFRQQDELFPPAPNSPGYYRAALLSEYLGLSQPEYSLFIDANPAADWFQLYGQPDEATAKAQLPNAKTLSGLLGVTYDELVALVQTWFVNPGLDALFVLRKLALPIDQIYRYKGDPRFPPFTANEQAAFVKRLADLHQQYNFDVETWLETTWQSGEFNKALVLIDGGGGCDFSTTTFAYADGAAAEPLVFMKLALFVRLWRKLRWTIDELDQALRVFMPQQPTLTDSNLGTAMRSVLVYVAHLAEICERAPLGKDARLKTLALWTSLSTRGVDPLYAKLFLTPSVLKLDATFDSVDGNYLADNTVHLAEHQSAVQAALALTADDVAAILRDGNPSATPANTVLSLATVSQLYRYSVVAKALKLGVADLITLMGMSGLAPFTPLIPTALTQSSEDQPLHQTLPFFDVVDAVRGSGFKVEDVAWLWRHSRDVAGKYADDPQALLTLVQSLATQIDTILDENAVPGDPSIITDDWLRQRFSLVLPADIAGTFLGMWTGAIEYSASPIATTKATATLVIAALASDSRIHVVFDDVRQQLDLTFRGVLVTSDEQTILAPIADATVKSIASQALDDVHTQAQAYFNLHFANSPSNGFLTAADFDALFTPIDPSQQDKVNQRRLTLAQAFVPFFEQKLIRDAIVQTVLGTTSKTDPVFFQSLLTDTQLLEDPSAPGEPLLDGFLAASARGVTAQFFASTDATGTPIATTVAPSAGTSGRPVGTNSARFDGFLGVPAAGPYRFFVRFADANTEAEFDISNRPDPLVATAAMPNDVASQFTDLNAGVLYPFSLIVRKLGAGDVTLTFECETLVEGSLARLRLHPAAAVDRVQRARVLLDKVLQLTATLPLDERELRHMQAHPADFDNLNLSALPTTDGGAPAPFGWFLRLAAYGALKRDLQAGPDDLVAIFEIARRTAPAGLTADQVAAALFADLAAGVSKLTRRRPDVVASAAKQFGFDQTPNVAPSFASEIGLGQLWKSLQVAEKVGFPVAVMATWAVPDPTSQTARDLRNAVKARYDDDDSWRAVAKSIFDPLRQAQRDALVAFVLQQLQLDRPEQLFEYFLVDTGMEPVVLTSRLRLAISSVQTFIQRCLLNLESLVPPSQIDADRWKWMKRYRYWEANRKIFLFPENWLEPEFRDDKTHLYKAFEAALVQGDINTDLVEDLFYRYLTGLEEIARLHVLSCYLEIPDKDPRHFTLHVVARTQQLPYKYFYRRLRDDQWTPWEPITTEIDGGDNVAIAIWHQRVHVFWVSFLKKSKATDETYVTPRQAADKPLGKPDNQVDIQLSWTEHFQGKWTPRKSSGFGVVEPVSFYGQELQANVLMNVSGTDDDGLHITVRVGLFGTRAFLFKSKNSPPESVDPDPLRFGPIEEYIILNPPQVQMLALWDNEQIADDDTISIVPQSEVVLNNAPAVFRTAPCDNEVHWSIQVPIGSSGGYTKYILDDIGPLAAPFFYQDNQCTFFVNPIVTETAIDEWDGWAISSPAPDPGVIAKGVVLQPANPQVPIGPDPDPVARYKIAALGDWLADPGRLVQFGGSAVGATGRVGNVADVATSRSLLGGTTPVNG